MKKALEDLAIQVTVMKEPAKMDGGDVLFTGKEFFVGLSRRTNEEGLEAFKKVFPDYPVHGIEILEGSLHIKSVMTLVGDNVIAVGNSKAAQHALQEMKSKMKIQYNFLQVPHDAMANGLFINDHVIHRPVSEFPGIKEEYASLPYKKLELPNSEFYKVDGCLTCRSILIE